MSLDQLNGIRVPPDLLAELVDRNLAAMQRTGRISSETHAGGIAEMLIARGYRSRQRGELAIAVLCRYGALAHFILSGHAQAWIQYRPAPEAGFLHADVIRAAAEEPMIEGTRPPVMFDPESFKARVLRLGKTGGRAST